MKKINEKGFTLIELLAVIVILGVIMLIAIPSISSVMTNSRKDSFIRSMDSYIDAVRNMATSGTVKYLPDTSKASVVSLRAVDLEKMTGAEAKSPFDALWQTTDTSTEAYVVIWNGGSAASPRYEFYFAGRDMAGNCIPLTREGTAERSDITTGCEITPITEGTTTITINGNSGINIEGNITLK